MAVTYETLQESYSNFQGPEWKVLVKGRPFLAPSKPELDRTPERFLSPAIFHHRQEIIDSISLLKDPSFNSAVIREEMIASDLSQLNLEAKQVEIKPIPTKSYNALLDVNLHSAFDHYPDSSDGAPLSTCLGKGESSFNGRELSNQQKIAINAWVARSEAVRDFEGYIRSVFDEKIADISVREIAFRVVSINLRKLVAEQARRIELEDTEGVKKISNLLWLFSQGVLPIGFKYDQIFIAWRLPFKN